MRKAWFLSLIVLFLFCSLSIAADKVGMFGAPNTSGTGPMEVDSDRVITVAADAKLSILGATSVLYERATTGDTITATEAGKVFSVACGIASCEFELPAAVAGMQLTFVTENAKSMYLDPADVNGIIYAGLSTGDKFYNSSAATGDSVTLTSTRDSYWSVSSLFGTWADGN